METDLHAVIRANILEPVHKQFIVYQCLKALLVCHSGGLIHRDLKPSNLLLNEECLCKVADFGLARSLRVARGDEASVLTDYVMTRWYRAPEIILGSTSYTLAVDMWALGCIVAEMFSGKPILNGSSTMNQLERILEITGVPNAEQIAGVESKFAETMLKSIKPQERKDLASMMTGAPPEAVDMVRLMLEFNPKTRMTIEQALAHPFMKPFTTGKEAKAPGTLRIPIDDDIKYSVSDYRDKLYQLVCTNRKDRAGRMASYFSTVLGGAGRSSSVSQ